MRREGLQTSPLIGHPVQKKGTEIADSPEAVNRLKGVSWSVRGRLAMSNRAWGILWAK
jgi:hypothetical protein